MGARRTGGGVRDDRARGLQRFRDEPCSPTVPVSPAPPPAPRLIRQGSVPLGSTDGRFLSLLSDPHHRRRFGSMGRDGELGVSGQHPLDLGGRQGCVRPTSSPAMHARSTRLAQCRFVSRSETATPKPRVLTIPGAGGTRTLIFANLGPGAETVQYRVTLTGSSAATSGSAQTASVAAATGNVAPVSTARKARLPRK